jgi:predicted XRE-type DNA-binding protein
MAREWNKVRADAAGLIDEEKVAAAKETLRAEVRAARLADVRKSQKVTQSDVARGMGVAQPRVSAIEHGKLTHTEVGTLAAYVDALGGRLRIVVDFDDESIVVRD